MNLVGGKKNPLDGYSSFELLYEKNLGNLTYQG